MDSRTLWGVAEDGATIELTVPASRVSMMADRWPPMGLTQRVDADDEQPEPSRRVVVSSGGLPGVLAVTVNGGLTPGGWHRVESELALFAADHLAHLVAVHAAVIVIDGRAIVIPGPSFSGKSTLCVAAADAGLAVLTDEYALVDPVTGLVTGWPRPVRVRQPNGTLDRLDLITPSDPVAVGLIALLHYDPSAASTWAAIPAAEAVIGLMANTVCAQSRPDASLDAALALARNAPAVAGPRADANEALANLITLVTE